MTSKPEAYDVSAFDPPAPVARVRVPREIAEQAGIAVVQDKTYQLAGFDGTQSAASAADLDMILLGRVYRGRYLLTDEVIGILGRDVLNHLVLRLDGPQQLWSPQ